MDSFLNIMNFIVSRKTINSNDIIIYHDSVRPFTSYETVDECIDSTLIYKLATVAKPVTYTVLESPDGNYLDRSVDRKTLFEIHTPSDFNLELLYNEFKNVDEQTKKRATCTSQLMIMQGHKVKTVTGHHGDFKITTDTDLNLAKYIIKNNKNI